MFNAAHMKETFEHDAKGYGYSFSNLKLDYSVLKKNRDDYVKKLNGIYNRNWTKEGIEFIPEKAEFVDKNTLKAGDKTYTAKHIVVAAGGRPAIPNIPGKEHVQTSDDFFNKLDHIPKKTAVVGAGYIAVELGHVLQTIGSDVSLFYRRGSVLRTFDKDLQDSALTCLKDGEVTLVGNTTINEIKKNNDNTFTLVDQHKKEHSGFDYVLYAIGRGPMSDILNIEKVGLKTDKKGHIISDELEQTNVEGVYSLGDINGKIELTPVAIAAGRTLAERLFNGKKDLAMDYVN
eukprot:UN02003